MTSGRELSGPTLPTIKKLFALSGNRCSFPECGLSVIEDSTVTGEICHIKGGKPESARHDPEQPASERHSYENLILLCSRHHKIIDSNPKLHSVEHLHGMKKSHEQQALALPDSEAEAGASLLLDQSVTSVGQTGGVTAHSVTINVLEGSSGPGQTHRAANTALRSGIRERQ